MRLRPDYVFGTTDAALTTTDTTLSSPNLASLPAISGGDIAAVTLYDGTNYEIVHVTAHTAAATTATIVRGQEDSTAQAWVSGTDWYVGATSADFPASAGSPEIITAPTFTAPTSSTMVTLAVGVLNQANKYTLGTWLPATHPGTGLITPASNAETDVRPISSAALGLAAGLSTGTYDATATGVSETSARTECVRMTAGLAAAHVANGGTWGGTTANPPNAYNSDPTIAANWQSALWAADAAAAAWLTADDLSDDQLADVAAMIAYEADRMIGWTLPYYRDDTGTIVYTGDTKAEEVAWDASAVQTALLMLPNHPHAPQWRGKFLEMALAAYSKPADVSSTARVNGLVLADTLNGSNVNADGTVVNQSIVAPDYMMTGAYSTWGHGLLATALGRAVPAAVTHNGEAMYQALTTLNFSTEAGWDAPGGTIYKSDGTLYYPDGSTWGTSRIMHAALMDVVAHAYGWDSGVTNTAEDWAVLHLQAQADLQARDTTGQTYQLADEDTYAGREQWVAAHAGLAVLTLYGGTPLVSNAHAQVLESQTRWAALAATPAAATGVQSVVAGTGISVDSTDPENPVVSATGGAAPTFIGAKAVKSTTQNFTNGTSAAVTFPAADAYDTDAIHDPATNSSRMTIPAGMGGVWRFTASTQWASVAAGNHRTALFAVNGVNQNDGWQRQVAQASLSTSVTTTADLSVAAGDYVEVIASQGSGSALDMTSAYFSAHYLGAP